VTPAQAYGHPNFVTDVPVQGPTDEGVRAGDCWWAQNRLPAQPACVDCNGPVPQWAKNSLCPGNRLTNSGLGEGFMETISFGGRGALGFALGAAGDPAATLTDPQRTWVQGSLVLLNSKILSTTGSSCATWVDPGVNLTAAVNCFQQWYNANKPSASVALRTDGVLDNDTVSAIQFIASQHPSDFNVAFPGSAPAAPAAASTKSKLSTGEMVGIAAAGAAALGGVVYAATRKGGGRRRKRR